MTKGPHAGELTGPRRHPHGTQEWATSNVNLQIGCEHDCRYCYAKAMGIRFGRTTAQAWRMPVPRQTAGTKRYQKRAGRIMFPSSHDITSGNLAVCLRALEEMLAAGNEVLVVMKPELDCVRQLCRALVAFKQNVMFRFTIGSASDATLAYWEPHAPTFKTRLAALKHAHSLGYKTSVSCEPMLDGDVDAVIRAVRPYVTDSIWLGKANHLRQIVSINCAKDTEALKRADAVVHAQDDSAIHALYNRYKSDPLIRWKDSIKKVVGLRRPERKGLDV